MYLSCLQVAIILKESEKNGSCHKSVSSITENEKGGSLSHLRGWKSQLRTECVQTYKVRFHFF